jgi:hypothetical protein
MIKKTILECLLIRVGSQAWATACISNGQLVNG